MNPHGPEAQASAESQLADALRRVFALAAAYRDFTANQNFVQRQAKLSRLENKIAAARRLLNDAMSAYNAASEQAPSALLARPLRFQPRGFSEPPEPERAAVQAAPVVRF